MTIPFLNYSWEENQFAIEAAKTRFTENFFNPKEISPDRVELFFKSVDLQEAQDQVIADAQRKYKQKICEINKSIFLEYLGTTEDSIEKIFKTYCEYRFLDKFHLALPRRFARGSPKLSGKTQ